MFVEDTKTHFRGSSARFSDFRFDWRRCVAAQGYRIWGAPSPRIAKASISFSTHAAAAPVPAPRFEARRSGGSPVIGKLNHVGVATPSIDDSVKLYREMLGATSVTEKWAMPE
jgi:hypothetical protein